MPSTAKSICESDLLLSNKAPSTTRQCTLEFYTIISSLLRCRVFCARGYVAAGGSVMLTTDASIPLAWGSLMFARRLISDLQVVDLSPIYCLCKLKSCFRPLAPSDFVFSAAVKKQNICLLVTFPRRIGAQSANCMVDDWPIK